MRERGLINEQSCPFLLFQSLWVISGNLIFLPTESLNYLQSYVLNVHEVLWVMYKLYTKSSGWRMYPWCVPFLQWNFPGEKKTFQPVRNQNKYFRQILSFKILSRFKRVYFANTSQEAVSHRDESWSSLIYIVSQRMPNTRKTTGERLFKLIIL